MGDGAVLDSAAFLMKGEKVAHLMAWHPGRPGASPRGSGRAEIGIG